MSFAARLAEARRARGLSSNALATQLGISSTAVWNWDHGNSKPRPEMLERVAALLGVSPAWLKDGEVGDLADDASRDEGVTVDRVLATAKSQIASIMRTSEHRLRLELTVVA